MGASRSIHKRRSGDKKPDVQAMQHYSSRKIVHGGVIYRNKDRRLRTTCSQIFRLNKIWSLRYMAF